MLLEIKNLSKSFGEKNVLKNFSYVFPQRGVFAIVGESGAGKTTLLRILANLDHEYLGDIIPSRNSKISFAFQEHRLFPSVSAIDNLTLVSFESKNKDSIEKSEKMLASLGFNKTDMTLLPHELSGGMKQRISLARAFLREADILLLDEPTKELDKENIALVIEEIKRQAKSRLVIMVTHRKEDIELLDAQVINI